MLSLSKYLHDLGIILHFQKDPILKHLVILRPEWATNAVYKVTDNKQVITNCGYFTQENLSEIWRDREYNDLHDELLQLMKNFKLCYEIPCQPGQYIAPQRLPLEPPKYDWDDNNNLIVRYEYEFMPKGIITRLIVEMHPLIYRPDDDPPKSPLPRGTFEDASQSLLPSETVDDPPKSPLPRGTFEDASPSLLPRETLDDPPKSPLPRGTFEDASPSLLPRGTVDDPPKSPLPRGTFESETPVPPLLRGARGDLVWRDEVIASQSLLPRGTFESETPVPPLIRGARGDLVWREGVIFTDNYAKAEVIENYHQREIRIRVSGNQKKSLLDRIRHEAWKIHAAYDNRLKYKEFIPCNCPQCKGSQDPHLYDFDALRRRLDNRRYEVECEKTYQMVNVRGLMDDFPDYSRQAENPRISGIDKPNYVDPPNPHQIIYHVNLGANKMTQDSSQTNNFQGANLSGNGFIVSQLKDNSQISNNSFIQNNNANTAELL
jgi:hypothetical protein